MSYINFFNSKMREHNHSSIKQVESPLPDECRSTETPDKQVSVFTGSQVQAQ